MKNQFFISQITPNQKTFAFDTKNLITAVQSLFQNWKLAQTFKLDSEIKLIIQF